MDLERFRTPCPTPAIPQAAPKKGRRLHAPFIKGPIPMSWVEKAAQLPGKAILVALELWRESGCRSSVRDIPLSTQKLKRLGVGRKAGYSALSRLEAAGLVTVVRRNGCLPLVTIMDVANGQDGRLEGAVSTN